MTTRRGCVWGILDYQVSCGERGGMKPRLHAGGEGGALLAACPAGA